ncbi:MAG: cysteine desulfurase [Alphaproteobacteria bacterium]|nr:cysteine desulfurase [Alphaproteobacteria bacterium]
MSERRYLDYNAVAPLRPEVAEVMRALMLRPLNPSSLHAEGREARSLLEKARKEIAELVNCFANEIIFTGSATEANATALSGTHANRVLVSAIEHLSVLNAREDAVKIPVTPQGTVNLTELERLLADGEGQALVSVMLANNETGVVQPMAEIARIVRAHGAKLHVDAVQAIGKTPLDFTALDADMLTISSHKIGGPVGIAALVVKDGILPKPFIPGGKQEMGRRAGTEAVALATGMAKALELAVKELPQLQAKGAWLRKVEKELAAQGAVVFGEKAERIPNTLSIAMPGVSHETQLMAFDLAGIAVSAGSACSSGRVSVSHVLQAMQVPVELASSAIRVSIGWATTEEDITAFIREWEILAARLAPGLRKKAA